MSICDNKDWPWFNNKIETLIQAKYADFNRSRKNSGHFAMKGHLESLQEHLNVSIESSKYKHYYRMANKLNNTQKNLKVIGRF